MVSIAAGLVFLLAADRVQAQTPVKAYQIFAWNDLGMHCYDSDYSVFSILPPFNTVHAQVVKVGTTPVLSGSNSVSVYYVGVADPSRSINTTSIGKTNFWAYSKKIYGGQPPSDTGLVGSLMPGRSNAPRAMGWATSPNWASATGIPITCIDDGGKFNPYPMFQFRAVLVGSSSAAAAIDAVVPVSNEMNCKACHVNGGIAAGATQVQKYGLALSKNSNPNIAARENILRLHDAEYGTQLWASRPVLCASCHYSKALDLAGNGVPTGAQVGHEYMSQAMHRRHGKSRDNQTPTLGNPAIISQTGVKACYYCHPGNDTNCLRSVMATKLVSCQQCHGDLLAVGGYTKFRDPWADMPKCQSCHTGDFVNNLGGSLPRTFAFATGDATATPILAPASRFAENSGTLYRYSTGHGGLACSACHGSTHAEWPATNPNGNDNITAKELQGHAGPIVECSTCHGSTLSATLGGPHGMHNVSQTWVSGHEDLVGSTGLAACQACHGTTLQGTYLSVAAADRSFHAESKTVKIAKGTAVSCTLCHGNPLNGGG
jgi:hypothetical protein